MTATKTVKAAGLKSLSRMIELTGIPRQTLIDWHRDKPEKFDKQLKLCVAYINK